MGIPSYYKKLTDTHPGLIQAGHPAESVQWLFMDFNCLIYHCIQQPDMPVYQGDDSEWQRELLVRVVDYTKHVIQTVAPVQGVYIAIDGVVPMAKMRQQRLRRFKSQWLSERGATMKWDTNAITPGTAFMELLHAALETAAKYSSKKWILSTSNQVGEGEHKIIAEWRKKTYEGNYAVYGLDADLIVLSLLTREMLHLENKVWLFREQMEKGACVYQDGQECFEWFCIHELREWLSSMTVDHKVSEWILTYCAAMSILGNDFLPRSLGLTLREDGHAKLLHHLRGLEGQSLVDMDSLELRAETLFSLFRSLAGEEEEDLRRAFDKRRRMAQIFGTSETGLGESNWPLVKREEEMLMTRRGGLKQEWQRLYLTHFFSGMAYTSKHIQDICTQYLHGIQWTWAYYTGQTECVCYDWYYPYSLPPLWTWLASSPFMLPSLEGSVSIRAQDIDPQEQLGLVLPPKSWDLIRDPRIRQLRRLLPHYFPTNFGFESVGKRYFWECEAILPVPSLSEIKAVLISF